MTFYRDFIKSDKEVMLIDLKIIISSIVPDKIPL